MGDWIGTAITGLVGIVGMVTTVATIGLQRRYEERAARREREFEVQDLLRQERRDCYRSFLNRAHAIEVRIARLLALRLRVDANDASAIQTLSGELDDLHDALATDMQDIDLLASDGIGMRAGHVVVALTAARVAVSNPDLSDVDVQAAILEKWLPDVHESRINLVSMMRWDLSYVASGATPGSPYHVQGDRWPSFTRPDASLLVPQQAAVGTEGSTS